MASLSKRGRALFTLLEPKLLQAERKGFSIDWVTIAKRSGIECSISGFLIGGWSAAGQG